MDTASLITLVDRLRSAGAESETVEFKVNWNRPRDIGEYVSALANSAVLANHDRAWIIWGVDDASHAVIGTHFNPAVVKAHARAQAGT